MSTTQEPEMSDLKAWIDKIICGDCLELMKQLPDGCVDELATDPPYGYSFMGKDWDRAVPKVEVWQECLRVMKPGAFGFILCAPRQDCLSRMIVNLEDAGFWVNFSSLYWAYASGFPKAQNISKVIDKRLGIKREQGKPSKYHKRGRALSSSDTNEGWKRSAHENYGLRYDTFPASPQAKAFDGSYAGFQPKPAVEVILVVMKPLSEKTFVDQALKNGKGITWLDGGRIPYENEDDHKIGHHNKQLNVGEEKSGCFGVNKGYGLLNSNINKGRFPANLLVQDDVLNDGRTSGGAKARKSKHNISIFGQGKSFVGLSNIGDSGSFSRYFDLDRWFAERIKQLPKSVQKTFPFLIVPKASKAEKNKGCGELPNRDGWNRQAKNTKRYYCKKCKHLISKNAGGRCVCENPEPEYREGIRKPVKNFHPTVKPLKLMCYLITLGSRGGGVVLDPYIGSGTTALGCQLLNRRYIGFDNEQEYVDIANERLNQEILSL